VPAHDFIGRALRAKRNVLVHCMAGRSRFVTIVAAYLMVECRMTREEALALIRSAREEAVPNAHFVAHLDRLGAGARAALGGIHVSPAI
jgi:dual specificity phosphatase 12